MHDYINKPARVVKFTRKLRRTNMPPKELKACAFKFMHNQKIYYCDTYRIYDSNGDYVCICDLTATNYYGDEEVMLICCKIALNAYFEGHAEGCIDAKAEMRRALGL
jgi:hypothetical protein